MLPRCPTRRARGALAAALAIAVGGSPRLSAQTVVGRVLDATDQRPVAGAFVVLLDAAGADHDRGLTTRTGTFRLRAPGAGTYRLNLERIGFEDLTTESFPVGPGEIVSRRILVAAEPIHLERIEARDEARCEMLAADAIQLAKVWEEARKALEATAWTNRQTYYRFDILRVGQALAEDGSPVGEPSYEPVRVYGRRPFRSIRAEDLAYGGWVQPRDDGLLQFFAPDAQVLLAESFLRRHCFRLVRPDSGRDRLGVNFEPLPGHRQPDISGVLWIDRSTAELLALDFRYERLPMPVESDLLGGRVEFDRLPDGAWIVSRWVIRTPRAGLDRSRDILGRLSESIRLKGLHLEGQQVTAVWRTGYVQAAPEHRLPEDVPPVRAPPDVLLQRFPVERGNLSE